MSGNLGANLINQLQSTPAAQPGYWGQQMSNMNALQDYQAKQATADAYRQSIDANGNFDQAGFNARIARGAGAWNAGPTMQQSGQAQGAQAQGQQEQIAAHRSRMDTMLGQMTDLLQSGKPIQAGDVIASLNQAHFSPGEASQITADMNAANPSHDPSFDYTGWVKNHQASNLAAGAQIALRTPNMQFVNTPQGAVAIDTNANTTKTPPGTALPYGVSPDTNIWNPDAYGPGQGGFVKAGGSVAPGTALPPGSGGSPQAAPPSVINRNPSLTVGQQANNSGNLMVPQGHSLPTGAIGVIPAAGGRQVAAFPDVPTGIAAQSDNLAAYKAQGINTIAGAVNRWVGDPNANNASYIADIAKAAGVDPNAPVDLTDPKIQRAFFMAQQPHESGASWLKPADVDRGIAMGAARRQGPQGGGQTAQGGQQPQQPEQPQATTTTPAAATPARPASPFGASAFAQPSTALPAPPSQATAPNTTAAVPPVPTPQMAAARALAVRTGRPAPIAGTDGLFVDKNGNVGSGPNAGGLGRRADIPNALLTGVQTAQTTMPPATALTAGPGAPTTGLPTEPAPIVPPANAFGSAAFGSAPAAAPVTPPPPVAQPAAPAPTRGAPGTLLAEPPPGYVEAQQITAKAAAARGNDLVNQLTASSTVKPILAEMEDVLTKSGGTGFGTAHISAFRQALERLGLTPAAVDVATPQAALETFKKLSAQLQGAQLGTVGGVPTDDRQSLIEASNPSTLNSTAGNKSIIHVLQGTQQALETMGRAWMASPEYQNNPGKFDDWRTKFTTKDPATGGQFDPRTFWLNNMPPDEQHAYLSNMTPKGMAEFKKNWAFARKQGWVDPLPGQPATAPAPGG